MIWILSLCFFTTSLQAKETRHSQSQPLNGINPPTKLNLSLQHCLTGAPELTGRMDYAPALLCFLAPLSSLLYSNGVSLNPYN